MALLPRQEPGVALLPEQQRPLSGHKDRCLASHRSLGPVWRPIRASFITRSTGSDRLSCGGSNDSLGSGPQAAGRTSFVAPGASPGPVPWPAARARQRVTDPRVRADVRAALAHQLGLDLRPDADGAA